LSTKIVVERPGLFRRFTAHLERKRLPGHERQPVGNAREDHKAVEQWYRRPCGQHFEREMLSLKVRGETAEEAGPLDDNLVLKAVSRARSRSAGPDAWPLYA